MMADHNGQVNKVELATLKSLIQRAVIRVGLRFIGAQLVKSQDRRFKIYM